MWQSRAYYSELKHQLISNVDRLIEQLRSTISRSRDELDLSCKSLDIVSKFVADIGVERAQKELYDPLWLMSAKCSGCASTDVGKSTEDMIRLIRTLRDRAQSYHADQRSLGRAD